MGVVLILFHSCLSFISQNNMISDMLVEFYFTENCKENVYRNLAFQEIRHLVQPERALENRFSVVYL